MYELFLVNCFFFSSVHSFDSFVCVNRVVPRAENQIKYNKLFFFVNFTCSRRILRKSIFISDIHNIPHKSSKFEKFENNVFAYITNPSFVFSILHTYTKNSGEEFYSKQNILLFCNIVLIMPPQ